MRKEGIKAGILFLTKQTCLGSKQIFHLPHFKCPSSPFVTKVLLQPTMQPELTSEKNTKPATRCDAVCALRIKVKIKTFCGKDAKGEVIAKSVGEAKDTGNTDTYISCSR